MECFSIVKVNDKYIESLRPTVWTEDSLMAQPFHPKELGELITKIVTLYHQKQHVCVITIEMLE